MHSKNCFMINKFRQTAKGVYTLAYYDGDLSTSLKNKIFPQHIKKFLPWQAMDLIVLCLNGVVRNDIKYFYLFFFYNVGSGGNAHDAPIGLDIHGLTSV